METCSAIPTPPAQSLFANKTNTEVEVDYSIFFVCSDPEAILDDQSGINFFEMQCRSNNDTGFNNGSAEHGAILSPNNTYVQVMFERRNQLIY